MMKRFLKYLAIFCFPILVIFVVLEVLIRHIPNDYEKKQQYLEAHAPEIEVLILGASHAFSGLNPDCFSLNAYNAAYVSQTFDIDYLIIEKYQARLTNLKYIILPVSYPSLREQLIYTPEYWRLNDYARYAGLPVATSAWYKSELLSNKFWYNLYRIADYYIWKHKAVLAEDNGWRRREYNPDTDMVTSGKEAAIRHTINNPKCVEDNMEILNKIIRFCNEQNVGLLLCTLPVYHTYTDHLDKEQLDELTAVCERFAHDSPDVYYINLLDDSRFTQEDFFDADHLDESGAGKASVIIDQFILRNNFTTFVPSKNK